MLRIAMDCSSITDFQQSTAIRIAKKFRNLHIGQCQMICCEYETFIISIDQLLKRVWWVVFPVTIDEILNESFNIHHPVDHISWHRILLWDSKSSDGVSQYIRKKFLLRVEKFVYHEEKPTIHCIPSMIKPANIYVAILKSWKNILETD